MTNQTKFEITIELKDYRKTEGLEPEKQVLCYRALIYYEGQHATVWSEPIQTDEIGTRRSYFNLLDGIRHRILKKLCPEESLSLPPNYQPATKQQQKQK